MEIGLYEDWMKPQIAKLFSTEYGIKEEDFARVIDNFYEHPFQKKKSIRIIAKENDVIIGFQSFFYWPYVVNGKTINSYQSGNSLVHPEHRGKGIFQKLLNYLDNHKDELNIELLIGFPVEASFGSFIRNKWTNILNLQWYVKLANPISLILPLNNDKLNKYLPNKNSSINLKQSNSYIKLSNDSEFENWRSINYDKNKYYSFTFQKDNEELTIKLKTNVRKKIIKELIIGDIVTTSYDSSFLNNAFNVFFKTVKKIKCISIISIAYNINCDNKLHEVLTKNGFKKTDKKIFFCIKPFTSIDFFTNDKKWTIYRGDIDTW